MQLVKRTTTQADIGVVVTSNSATKHRHPVFKFSRAHMKIELADYFGKSGRKMDARFAPHRRLEVRFADEPAFVNMNTPTDFQDWGAQ